MNKLILGGVLVTMMGGVPGVTYLLTRERSVNENKENADRSQVSEPAITCNPPSTGSNCPETSVDNRNSAGTGSPRVGGVG